MPPDDLKAVTDHDVRSLAAKLKGLHALLTPGEQQLLAAVFRRAAESDTESPDPTEVAWAVTFDPFPYLDAVTQQTGGREL